VDIGVHQDGLVHVSQLADRFIKDPNEVVKVQQRVMVTVMEVDLDRKRIALSMRANPDPSAPRGPAARTESTGPRPASPPRPASQPANTGPRPQPNTGWFSDAVDQARRHRN
jgi:uncharacterized protein